MDTKILFHKSDLIIRRINKLLSQTSQSLHKSGLPPQQVSDLKKGIVYTGGVYLRLDSIEHRILFDGYETIFIDQYLLMYKEVYKNRNNIITQFSLRTLAEMGFIRCQLLFCNELTKEEQEKYKLLLLLSDYGAMAFNNHRYRTMYIKLFEENKELLTEKQIILLNEYIESAVANDSELHIRLTRRTRKLVDSVQDELFKKTTILPLFNPTNVNAFFSSFSHILHGNVFLLLDILRKERPTQHKLRVYWVLLLTGVNVLNRISSYTGDKEMNKKILKLNKDFEIVAIQVKSYWSSV